MKWRGIPSAPIETLMQSWEGEEHVVFFDPSSGDTHLLSALAGLLLELLDHRTHELDTLVAAVREALGPTPENADTLPAQVHEHLQLLSRLGLVQELPA